jgi:hypothetical protein
MAGRFGNLPAIFLWEIAILRIIIDTPFPIPYSPFPTSYFFSAGAGVSFLVNCSSSSRGSEIESATSLTFDPIFT